MKENRSNGSTDLQAKRGPHMNNIWVGTKPSSAHNTPLQSNFPKFNRPLSTRKSCLASSLEHLSSSNTSSATHQSVHKWTVHNSSRSLLPALLNLHRSPTLQWITTFRIRCHYLAVTRLRNRQCPTHSLNLAVLRTSTRYLCSNLFSSTTYFKIWSIRRKSSQSSCSRAIWWSLSSKSICD